ncbi:hypothetical protein DdX_08495 [Ditylenchus destructor]|uniref:DUF5641 domain-containing protein n=1 Tax=Ditylenchus destructor TaxID=166010 RepID=A0AAD4N7T4_9BILA|nr:hypothetical protein DdX_08495 [Ditylenchus destructor]
MDSFIRIASSRNLKLPSELAHNSDEQLLHSNQSHTVLHKVVPPQGKSSTSLINSSSTSLEPSELQPDSTAMSAPFRQLIGPAKSRLQRYTTEVDDLLLDNRPEDEDQHLFLRDARLLKTRLVNVIALLSEQNNRWQQYIAGLPTAEKAAANQEYSDFDTGEDAFTIVLDHGREALDTLQAAIDDETSQTGTEQLLQNLTGTAPNRHTPTNRTTNSLLSEDLGPLPQNPTNSVPRPNQTDEGLFQSPANYNRGLFQPTNERSGGLFQLPANEGDNLFQLPPIKMLRFNGNRADWASFWDMFNVGVHSRMMSRIEKYTRLLSLLYGEAEQFIKGYPYSADAYPLVIEALTKRYGQTDILAENIQAELLNMPPAQDNIDSLRKTSEAIDRICRQMKLLGHSEEHPVLHTAIKSRFPRSRQVLWSDSMCALRWIASTDDNSKFVTNRLREIRLTDCEFRFVPTALNPADLSTRGCSVQELKSHPLWWSGPDWLVGPDSNWPQQLSVMPPPDTEPVPKLINAERFSSWNTLVRTTMIAMRFLKHRPFNAEDYKLATFILLQLHQQEKSISDREMANLKFFKDQDGLIRLRSRMGNADWTEDSIHPIVLWKDTHFTVGKNVLTFDELQTFVSEVEASMNHRPLTYVTTDAEGILPLRPIDFIQPKALVLLEGPLLDDPKDTEYRPVTFSRDRAIEAWKATLAYQAKFWERWSDEYLQMLRERSQWTHRAPRLENSTSPKVGEVVLLHDNLRPKNLWKMGRIAEVFETPNGIRTAKVFMGKDSTLTRPVNKLYSLEVSDYSVREVEPPLVPDPADPAPDPMEAADPTDDTAPRYHLRVNPKKKALFTAPVLTTASKSTSSSSSSSRSSSKSDRELSEPPKLLELAEPAIAILIKPTPPKAAAKISARSVANRDFNQFKQEQFQ